MKQAMRMLAILTAGAALMGKGYAQEAVAPAAPTPSAGVEADSDEVIVTARKREESLLRTPVAITAVGEAQLRNEGITNLDGIRSITPGLFAIDSPVFKGTMANFIRGIGETGTDQSADPVISTYVNGVYMPHSSVSIFNLFDVSNVQVLRGAQGTLFGKNSTSGAVMIETISPGSEYHVELNGMTGSNALYQLTGAVDLPLSNAWAMRLSAGHRESDGDYINGQTGAKAGAQDVSFGRMTVTFDKGQGFDARFVADIMQDGSDTPGIRTTLAPGLLTTTRATALPAPAIPYSDNRPGLVYFAPGENEGEINQRSASLTMNWDVGALGTLTSVTGFFDLDAKAYVNNSGIPDEYLTYRRLVERELWSQELRLASSIGKLDLVSGVYYAFANVQDGNLIGGRLFGSPTASQPAFKIDQDNEAYAVFFDGIYPITERVRINVGARYSYETKSIADGVNCAQNYEVGDFSACTRVFPADESWSSVDPKIGIDMDLTDELLAYAKFSTAFRSGGFNGRSAIGELGPYRPETVDAAELGLKGKFLDGRGRFAVAAFWNKYEDLQLQFVRRTPNPFPPPAVVNDTVVRNAASETTSGVELEGSIKLFENFSLSGSAAYLDAKFGDDFIIDLGAPTGIVNLSNNTPRFSPKWTTSVRANYDLDLQTIGSINANVTVSTSSSYQSFLNTVPGDLAFTLDDGYSKVDAAASWTSANDRYRIMVAGKNLTDENYIAFANQSPGVAQFYSSAPPRTFFVELGLSF